MTAFIFPVLHFHLQCSCAAVEGITAQGILQLSNTAMAVLNFGTCAGEHNYRSRTKYFSNSFFFSLSTISAPSSGAPYLHEEVVAALAEAFQHAQEQVSGLHQVLQEGAWLPGLIEPAQQSQEDLPELHQVEDVTCTQRGPHTGSTSLPEEPRGFFLLLQQDSYYRGARPLALDSWSFCPAKVLAYSLLQILFLEILKETL